MREGAAAAALGPAERFAAMLDLLHNDKLWASEYKPFVLQVSLLKR